MAHPPFHPPQPATQDDKRKFARDVMDLPKKKKKTKYVEVASGDDGAMGGDCDGDKD